MRWVFAISFLIFSVFSINQASAHMAGGEIGWKYLGKDTIKITFRIYRDCNWSVPATSPIRINSGKCGTKTYSTSRKLIGDVTPVCKNQCSRCTSTGCTFRYGYQLYELSATVVLSDWRAKGCCNIIISADQCCRPRNINTGSSGQRFYVDAQLDLCASQPLDMEWKREPMKIVCLGRDYLGLNTVITNNSTDSIVYSFADPKLSASGKTTWSNTYSSDKPFYFLGFPKATSSFPKGLHYNSETGEMQFRPMKEEVTVVATKAEVYQKGKKAGQTTRDQLLVILKCPNNNPPVVSGYDCSQPTTGSFDIYACAGHQLSFDVCTSDKDKKDTVFINALYSLPGATDSIINKGDKRQTLNFSWTPDSSHIRKAPYLVSVAAADNACPLEATSTRQFKIYVLPAPKLRIEHVIKDCGKVLLITHNPDTIKGLFRRWIIDGEFYNRTISATADTFEFNYVKGGFKQVNVVISKPNHCTVSRQDTFTLPKDFAYLQHRSDTLGCENNIIKLETEVKNPQGSFKVKWGTGDSSSLAQSSTLFSLGSRDTFTTVTFTDKNCTIHDTIWMRITSAPQIQLVDSVFGCIGDSIEATAFYLDKDSSIVHKWSFNGKPVTSTPVPINPGSSIKSISTGYFKLNSTSRYGCLSADSVHITHKTDNGTVSLPDTQLCNNMLARLGASARTKGDYTWYYNWPNQNLVVKNTDSLNYIFKKPAWVGLQFIDRTHGIHCTFFDSFRVDTFDSPDIKITGPSNPCRLDEVDFTAVPKTGFWTYSKTTYNGDSLTLVAKTANREVKYQYSSPNGCKHSAYFPFNVQSLPSAEFDLSDTVMTNAFFSPDIKEFKTINSVYKWTIGSPVFDSISNYSFNWSFDTTGTFPVVFNVIDQTYGCNNKSVKSLVLVKPTGLDDRTQSILIYPNPAKDVLHIDNPNKSSFGYSMINATGKTVAAGSFNTSSGVIDVSSLTQGVYFVRLEHYYIQKIFIRK